MLMSENRPEWGIAYFAILLAGGTAVPLDKELTPAEVVNLARVARPRGCSCCRRRVAERLCADLAWLDGPTRRRGRRPPTLRSPRICSARSAAGQGLATRVLAFDELLVRRRPAIGRLRRRRPRATPSPAHLHLGHHRHPQGGDAVSHKNFTADGGQAGRHCSRCTSTTSC
jgi:hypothetical protein